MDVVLNIAPAGAWAIARQTGSYEPPTLETEGFIHLSRPEQVHLPANALYSDTPDLVLLWIDPTRVTAEIRDEPPVPGAGMTFPHLYGPLNVEAVVAESPLRPWKRGEFTLPAQPSRGMTLRRE